MIWSAVEPAVAATPTWIPVIELIGAVLLLIGALFTLIAAIGLFRFHDLYARMHAATKPQMLGLMLICGGIALTLHTWYWVFLCTLVVAIQMLAAPVGSHLLGRAAYRTGVAELGNLTVDELAEDSEVNRQRAGQWEPGATHESSSQ